MGWIDEYIAHQQQKARNTESKKRYLERLENEKAGRQTLELQAAAALKPVTTEVIKTTDALHEIRDQTQQDLAKIKEALNLDALAERLDKMQEILTSNKLEPFPSPPPATIFDIEPGLSVLEKYSLPHPSSIGKFNHKEIINLVTATSKALGGKKANSQGEARKGIDEELLTLRKYKEALDEAMIAKAAEKKAVLEQQYLSSSQPTGKGAVMYYKHPDELKNRLRVLFGEMRAGNASVDVQNEAVALVDKLHEESLVDASQKRQLYEKVYSF